MTKALLRAWISLCSSYKHICIDPAGPWPKDGLCVSPCLYRYILAWCSQSRKGFCLIHLWSCCGKCCWCWFRPLHAFGCCSGRVHGSSSNGSNGAGVCCALLDSGSRRRASRGPPMIDRDTQRKRERERELSILIYNGTPRLISIAGGWMDGRTLSAWKDARLPGDWHERADGNNLALVPNGHLLYAPPRPGPIMSITIATTATYERADSGSSMNKTIS